MTTKLCEMASDFTKSAFCQKFQPASWESGFFLELSR